jgi:hypothetical protein
VKPAEELLRKINSAVEEMNETAVSQSKIVGGLLLEAKKMHPKVGDFDAFLKRVHGLRLSRAYELLAVAGGRTTDEEIRKDNRDRKKKQRDKTKSIPDPAETFRDITEKSIPEPGQPEPQPARDWPAGTSAASLREFKLACRHWLPELTDDDLKIALFFVTSGTWRAKQNEAA